MTVKYSGRLTSLMKQRLYKEILPPCRTVLQRDLDSLKDWESKLQVCFNKDKC